MRRVGGMLALALAMSAPGAARAQEGGAPAGVPADPATQVRTGESAMRMTVPVVIAGAGPYPFLIDTGAQRTVISRELAQTLGLLPGRLVRVTAMVGVAATQTVVIPSIAVGPGAAAGQGVGVPAIAGKGVEAPTFAAVNIGASGLLGLDMLQDRRVAIDMDAGLMTVSPAARRRRPPDPAGEIVVRAKSRFGQLIVTDAYAAGVRVRVVLDTGSMASIGNYALQRRLAKGRAPVQRISLTSVLGESVVADYTELPHVRISDLSIEALPVAYADAAPFRQLGLVDKPALLLGMDAIGLFRRVEIDFPNRELRLLLPRDLAAQRARQRGFPPG